MRSSTLIRNLALAAMVAVAPACVFQPMHGVGSATYATLPNGHALAELYVDEVDSRIGQQVRNQLIFLLQGGRDNPKARYRVKLRVVETNRQFAAVQNVRDRTAGSVTISVRYDIFDSTDMSNVASGSRVATAPYDRTTQSFANSRAVRDAENRAAKAVAEKLRLALAAQMSQ